MEKVLNNKYEKDIFSNCKHGKYTDDEFESQKKRISKQIQQKRLLLKVRWDQEFEMEKVLDDCFSFVRNTTSAWLHADYKTKIRLQGLIFENNIDFDGKSFGTPDLGRIYGINQSFQTDKTKVVDPSGFGPLASCVQSRRSTK